MSKEDDRKQPPLSVKAPAPVRTVRGFRTDGLTFPAPKGRASAIPPLGTTIQASPTALPGREPPRDKSITSTPGSAVQLQALAAEASSGRVEGPDIPQAPSTFDVPAAGTKQAPAKTSLPGPGSPSIVSGGLPRRAGVEAIPSAVALVGKDPQATARLNLPEPVRPRTFEGDGVLPGLDPAHPLVLLPVRIETRFKSGYLLVRVYPDEIFADSHERELTHAERRAAALYWSHHDAQGERNAWETLVQQFTASRAAWIVEATRPGRLGEPVGTKPGSWTREVVAQLLPDRWIVRLDPGVGGETVFTGLPIRPLLALSMKPPPTPPEEYDERGAPLAIDPELRWTIDFEEAVNAGMALRIYVGGVTHFNRVLVFGVRSGSGPRDTALALSKLFEAHRYTSGLALVSQGTRTNNTEAGGAGFTAGNRDGERHEPLSADPDAPRDEAVLTAALGLLPSTFQGIEGAGAQEQYNAQQMNEALWPATLGYFLAQRAEPFVSVALWDEVRTHFVHWVRGRGPLPCFRVGRVPYGVLPVSSLTHWVPSGNDGEDPGGGASGEFDKRVPELLRAGREIWRAAARDVPHIGRNPGDPDRDLLEVLGMDASAREVRVRCGLGPQVLLNAAQLQGLPPAQVALWCNARLLGLDSAWRERGLGGSLAATLYDDFAPRAACPLISSEPLSETLPLRADENYITGILSASLDSLRSGNLANPSGASLLFRLLRHGVLLEYVRVASDLRNNVRRTTDLIARAHARRQELEIIGVSDLATPLWEPIDSGPLYRPLLSLRRASRHLVPVPMSTERADFVAARDYTDAEFEPLAHALDVLAKCPTSELERLLTETLDTCSHRLDAWITSLFTKRLAAMRTRFGEVSARGCHVGAYARVENLQAQTGLSVSDGYIHGPSLDHAAAGAVLRNAFATHDDGEGRFAIDLSSARVQAAQGILDLVRAGQSLGEVLGYRVERALHEGRRDRYIDPLRQRFPLVANKMTDSHLPAGQVAARSVADGLAFFRQFDSFLSAGVEGGEDLDFFKQLYATLGQALDAVSDLLTAESVYQIVRGNTEVAGATLDAVAKGARPPDPEVVRSPRSGISITHRVALVLPPREEDASRVDLSMLPSVRAVLEPTLDAWVGRVLGDPAQVCCTVIYESAPDSAAGESVQSLVVRLQDLELAPLDVLALSGETPTPWDLEAPAGAPAGTAPPPPATEIDRHIVDFVARTRSGAKILSVVHEPVPLTEGVVRTFPALWAVARVLRDVLQSARPMRAEDLKASMQTSATVASPAPTPEVQQRAARVLQEFTSVCIGLATTVAATDIDLVRRNLQRAARFGIPGAFPVPASFAEGIDGAVRARALDVAREMIRRLAKAADQAVPAGAMSNQIQTLSAAAIQRLQEQSLDVSMASPGTLSAASARRRPQGVLLDALTALFGAPPALLLPFEVRDFANVRARFAAGMSIGATPTDVRWWLHGAARVRPALARWRKLALYLSTIPPRSADGGPESRVLPRAPEFQVAQFAPCPYDQWVALPFLQETRSDGTTRAVPPPSGTVSIAAHLPEGAPSQSFWTGLVIDEWAELIPNNRELTGIAFHHDDPGAEAAQAVLVAVPPAENVPWTVESLTATLDETFELATLRTVDAERLGPLGQFLPAIHLANNTAQDTVSTDFSGHLVANASSGGTGR